MRSNALSLGGERATSRETHGHRPGVEEAAGSCPWWRVAWAHRASGFPPSGAPGLSPDRGMERRAPRLAISGMGCSQALAHTSKDWFKRGILTCGQRWLHGAGLRIQIRQLAARRGRSSVGPSRMAAVAGSESAVGDLGHTERLSQEYRVPPAPVQTVSGPRSQGRRPSHSPGLSSARSLPFLAT